MNLEMQNELLPLGRQLRDILRKYNVSEEQYLVMAVESDGYISFSMFAKNNKDFVVRYTEFNEWEGNIYG